MTEILELESKCCECGLEFDGEYIEFDPIENKDVYRCYTCGGFNYFEVNEDEEEGVEDAVFSGTLREKTY